MKKIKVIFFYKIAKFKHNPIEKKPKDTSTLKSMWNYTFGEKTCNPNFSITVDRSDRS